MKNNKAFTLIELLGVIIILGIIMVIIIPNFNTTADKSEKNITLITTKKLVKAVENYIIDYEMEYGKLIRNTSIMIENNQIRNDIIDINGEVPKSGEIRINDTGDIAISIYDKVCIIKRYNWSEPKIIKNVVESNCTLDSIEY